MKFKRTTAKTLPQHLVALAAHLKSNPSCNKELAAEFNEWMDRLLGDDFFGTEGQCDPRGDHRS